MKKESSAYLLATREIPAAIYEKTKFIIFLAGFSTANLVLFSQITGRQLPLVILPVLSSIGYIVGSVADTYSSLKLIRKLEEASSLGIECSLVEANPLLPDRPTAEEFMNHPLRRCLEFVVLGIIPFLPSLGMGLGMARGVAALSNSRKVQRLERAIEMQKGPTS